ncbi:N-formylglutamate amidohydrolase [Magnetospira sp. QH-2]|uniref:N-formylglutamate amidohydrolase n=1 Tax=Magnetospira sp. (strain QH-2) TaxID=1288970 RepID=UPI0003E81C2F|nr:N-formylglutamate amidohydrolase [Magnetospira sp. QH-2]CCQ74340.1 N-formylglutamate amidohydrolase [Magnetospira sp. QH-2]
MIDPAFTLIEPAHRAGPLVLSSPHSGRAYPPAFVAASRLDPLTLRRSEDAFVEELFAWAPEKGIPFLMAHFPRAYLDPNREAWELDPVMYADRLPDYVNIASPRVAAGLGTVARMVTDGAEIYDRKIPFAEAQWRVRQYYEPYHAALLGLIERTKSQFGTCLLVDCHSMPSVGGPMDPDPGRRRADFVLGDCYGDSCTGLVIRTVEAALIDLGYRTVRNKPYSGGHTTRHYGRPSKNVHVLQIEINRDLYMDESSIERIEDMQRLSTHLAEAMAALAELSADRLGNGR